MFSNQIFDMPLIGLDFAIPLALTFLFMCLWGFFKTGKHAITPLSMLFLALAVNLGFGAVFRVFIGACSVYDMAVILGLLCSVIVLLLIHERFPQNPEFSFLKMRKALSPRLFGFATISTYAIFFILYHFNRVFELFWVAVLGLFPAVFFIGAIYALKNKYKLFFFFLFAACFVSIYIYYKFVFGGGGRINVAATLLTVLVVASWVRPSWLYKTLILVSWPFAMTWASVIELTRYNSMEMQINIDTTVQAFSSGLGLTSVLAPYYRLVEIISLSGVWGMRPFLEWLDQVVFIVLFWFPRVWWPNKPESFSKIIVYELEPELGSTTHSIATSYLGDFVYYTGMLGPAMGVITIILFVSVINKALNLVGRTSSSVWMLNYALFAYMSVQSLTLIWGGLSAYAPRGIAAMFGLSAVIFLWLFFRSCNKHARIRNAFEDKML